MTFAIALTGASFIEPGRGRAHDVTAAVIPGELLVVSGPEGSGKAVLLRGLCGLATLERGEAQVLGHDVRDGLVRGVVYASMHAPLLANMTIIDNLTLASRMAGTASRQAQAQAHALLDRTHLSAVASLRPHEVVPAQQRMATVVRALLVPDARLLLCEDPPRAAWPLLHEAVARGVTVIATARVVDEHASYRVLRLAVFADFNDTSGETVLPVVRTPVAD